MNEPNSKISHGPEDSAANSMKNLLQKRGKKELYTGLRHQIGASHAGREKSERKFSSQVPKF
jgi:hypothetical protein